MSRVHKQETRDLAILLLKYGYSSTSIARILNEKLKEAERLKESTVRYWRNAYNIRNVDKLPIREQSCVANKKKRVKPTEWNLTETSFLY